MSLFVALIFDSKSLQNNVLPRRVTAPWCQRIFPLSPALPPRSTSAARHRRSNPTPCCLPADSHPLLAACLTRYSDVTLGMLAGDTFGCLASHRPRFLLTYTPPNLSTNPQLLHPLLPVCCGAMGVPFDALYCIGMCTCTRLRSMTTTTIRDRGSEPRD